MHKREKLGRPVNRPVSPRSPRSPGAKASTPTASTSSLKEFPYSPSLDRAQIRTRLWSNPWWGGAILLLLLVYWTGRKLVGLV
ncbi:MAG: hypothetical protein CM1200mP29_13200 [Verrucomicrobiota bacterium]|nr:MAG: hypothetical protein CM1200mP29_13200 [Verrucomicrobiota bacterium]